MQHVIEYAVRLRGIKYKCERLLSKYNSPNQGREENFKIVHNYSLKYRLNCPFFCIIHKGYMKQPTFRLGKAGLYLTEFGRRPPSSTPRAAHTQQGGGGPVQAAGLPSCPSRRFLRMSVGSRAVPLLPRPPPPLSEHTPSVGPWSPGAESLRSGERGGSVPTALITRV